MSHPDRFPISGKLIKSVPWLMLARHETQAIKNHDHTLVELARCGGLSAAEAIDVLDHQRWDGIVFDPVKHAQKIAAYDADRERELIRRVEMWGLGG